MESKRDKVRWRECETECQSGRGTERKRDRGKKSEGQRETDRDRETEGAREGERDKQTGRRRT